MSKTYTDEEKARRVTHFRRVVKYRGLFGWVFGIVGVVLFFVGVKKWAKPHDYDQWCPLCWLWCLYGLAGKESSPHIGSRIINLIPCILGINEVSLLPGLRVEPGRIMLLIFSVIYGHADVGNSPLRCIWTELFYFFK